DPVDAPLQIEHPPVGADLHHPEPNSEVTVSLSRLTPAGVASSTDTMPTANTPAASLKSRRKARTVAATANASPIRLIPTARPGFPALAAADSSDPPLGSALGACRALTALEVSTAALAGAGRRIIHANTSSAAAPAHAPAGRRRGRARLPRAFI